MSALIIMFPFLLPGCVVSLRGRFLVQFCSPCTCFLWVICSAAFMSYHCYVDDTQIYFSAKPNNMNQLSRLHECLAVIKDWMSLNFLHFNPDKTEIIYLALINLSLQLISLLDHYALTSNPLLRIIFDQHMAFDLHVTKLVQSCFLQL